MHHLLVNWTTALGASSVNLNLGAPTDSVIPVQGGIYQLPWDAQILAAYAGITNGLDARINTPPFRTISQPYITPIQAQPVPSNAAPVMLMKDNPLIVPKTNSIIVAASTSAAGAADAAAALWISPGMRSAPAGPVYTVQWTVTPTFVKGAWVVAQPVLTQQLPAGRWCIVGQEVFGANLLAARIIFPDQIYRPGTLARNAAGSWIDQTMRYGAFGKFGEFVTYAEPLMEFFGTAAGANAVTGYWDIVQTGPY